MAVCACRQPPTAGFAAVGIAYAATALADGRHQPTSAGAGVGGSQVNTANEPAHYEGQVTSRTGRPYRVGATTARVTSQYVPVGMLPLV